MSDSLEDVIRMFRERLLLAFDNWLEQNKEAIGEKWYGRLRTQGRDCATPIEIMATSMWIFNMIAGFGVLTGIGPNKVQIHEIDKRLDEQSTRRLLIIISSCMSLQCLPKDTVTQPIPIISPKRFSLKVFTEQHS